MPLPSGLTLLRSSPLVDAGDGNEIGCAILYLGASPETATEWWGADARGPVGMVAANQATYVAIFGEKPSMAAVRAEIDPAALQLLDEQGTDGSSTWLTVP